MRPRSGRGSTPKPIVALAGVALLSLGSASFATAHEVQDDVPRTAVVSAFAPELSILKGELADASTYAVNGVEFSAGTLQGRDVVLFLSGISIVNAAMTTQLALDHFNVERIVFSGIAGGVDPSLKIGDIVIADRWGQYLEVVLAREVEGEWSMPPFFDYPYPNFGMMFPRAVTVQRAGADAPETRFWFPVDASLLVAVTRRSVSGRVAKCSAHSATTSPCQRRRTNSVAGRTSMPSSVRRGRGSRQTTMRSRTPGCSSVSVRTPGDDHG